MGVADSGGIMAENATINELVESSQGLVRFLAQQVKTRSPSWVEMDDLISYGQVGLLQAARDFDAQRGVKFSTFAFYRIRGSIFDGVNKLMWCRTIRDPETKYNQVADAYLESTSNDSTGEGQSNTAKLAQEADWFSRTVGALAVSFLASSTETDRTSEVVDKSARAPWAGLVQQETNGKLTEAIAQLAPESAALIRAVYFEDQTLQEAANRLKISKSWASRVHARALEQMARILRTSDVDESAIDDD